MLFWKSKETEKPKEPQSISQAFEEFAKVLTPEMINQIRTEHTRIDAQREGLDTARQDLAHRMESDMRTMLHHIAGTYFAERQGLRVLLSPEYADWLSITSRELTQQLAGMHHRLAHSPLPSDSLAVKQRTQSVIETSPELRERFDKLCAKFYYSGAIIGSETGSVHGEVYWVIAKVIEARPVGQNQPLSYREFCDTLEQNRAITAKE